MGVITKRYIETDVLVAGGGSAAAMAAIRAHDAGARVYIVSKAGLPSGASPIAKSGFQAALGHSDPADSPEVHYNDTLKAGAGLNNKKLVRAMTGDIIPIVHELDSWGADFVKKDGKFDQKKRVGCTYPRHVHHYDTTGKALMKCLEDQVKKRGIPYSGSTMVIDIVSDGSRAVGAMLLNYRELEIVQVSCRAVVLATGGAGQVFLTSDNPSVLTGDGYALACNLGVPLIDMEMIDFQLYVCQPESMKRFAPNSSAWIQAGARLYNGLGERFMRRYQPETLEKSSRAMINRAVGIELFYGRGTRGGGVYLDCSGIPGEDIPGIAPKVVSAYSRNGMDLGFQPMELSPGAHTFLGGILIDENGQTPLEGLYAAGEAAGGVHGANRLGGNAITDPLVFGARVGLHATRQAGRLKAGESPAWEGSALVEEWLGGEKGPGYEEVRHEIQSVMSGLVGLVRGEERLCGALRELDRVESDLLPRMRCRGTTGREVALSLKGILETRNILTVGRAIALSALARKESRGAHYRQDYPEQGGQEWAKHVAVCKTSGGCIEAGFIEL